MSVVLVGELNPYGGDPRYALFPYPRGCAGWRLQRLLGLQRRDYMRLRRVNLCVGTWRMADARKAAAALLTAAPIAGDVRVCVLLGVKVATAFGVGHMPVMSATDGAVDRIVRLPHPSGRCRVWDQPGAIERARQVLRDAAPEVPWGWRDRISQDRPGEMP